MIYHILFFILILGGYLYFKGKASINAKDGFLIWACCLMILQSGLRHVAVGADTFAYMGMFDNAQNNSWDFIWQGFIIHETSFVLFCLSICACPQIIDGT